jgi:hypothetical protein
MIYKPFFNVKLYRKIIQFPCFRDFPEVENNEMVKSDPTVFFLYITKSVLRKCPTPSVKRFR